MNIWSAKRLVLPENAKGYEARRTEKPAVFHYCLECEKIYYLFAGNERTLFPSGFGVDNELVISTIHVRAGRITPCA